MNLIFMKFLGVFLGALLYFFDITSVSCFSAEVLSGSKKIYTAKKYRTNKNVKLQKEPDKTSTTPKKKRPLSLIGEDDKITHKVIKNVNSFSLFIQSAISNLVNLEKVWVYQQILFEGLENVSGEMLQNANISIKEAEVFESLYPKTIINPECKDDSFVYEEALVAAGANRYTIKKIQQILDEDFREIEPYCLKIPSNEPLTPFERREKAVKHRSELKILV